MKKITTLVLSLVLVFAMSITAFAATEDDIIKALKDAGITGEYLAQAEAFLADNDVTAASADTVIAEINKAKETAGGTIDVASLSADKKNAIKNNVTTAAAAVGATVEFKADSKEVVVTSSTGKTYKAEVQPVKATGASTTATVAGIAVLAMGLVACGVAVSKKRFA